MTKYMAASIISGLALFISAFSFAGVTVDITEKEVDELKGTLRVRDLIVNDSARVCGSTLCIIHGKLFLPDNVKLQDKPVNDWGIDLKITVLPGNTVKATTVLPNTSDKVKLKNSIERFLSSTVEPDLFEYEPLHCNKRKKKDYSGMTIGYYEIQSIDGLNSVKAVYKKLLNDAGL